MVIVIIIGLLLIGWLYNIGGGLAVLFGIIVLVGIMFAIGASSNQKTEEFNEKAKNTMKDKDFNADRDITMPNGIRVMIDFKKEEIMYINPLKQRTDFISYKGIIDVELLVSGLAPVSASMGGALIGGVLAGATGAIIGSAKGKKEKCDDISVKILRSNKSDPVSVLKLINYELDRNSTVYKESIDAAQSIFSTLQAIVYENTKATAPILAPAYTSASAPAPAPDSTEELRKYKQLLDDGIITQDDFDAKKRQILGV